MKTRGSATTFHVADLATALQFYTEVLGFTQRFVFGDYAGVEHGEVQIHLSGPSSTNKRQAMKGQCAHCIPRRCIKQDEPRSAADPNGAPAHGLIVTQRSERDSIHRSWGIRSAPRKRQQPAVVYGVESEELGFALRDGPGLRAEKSTDKQGC